jgi:hypothetical protein
LKRLRFGSVLVAHAGLLNSKLLLAAPQHQGRVLVGEVPIPGVVVTATQGDKKFTAATNADGT